MSAKSGQKPGKTVETTQKSAFSGKTGELGTRFATQMYSARNFTSVEAGIPLAKEWVIQTDSVK